MDEDIKIEAEYYRLEHLAFQLRELEERTAMIKTEISQASHYWYIGGDGLLEIGVGCF